MCVCVCVVFCLSVGRVNSRCKIFLSLLVYWTKKMSEGRRAVPLYGDGITQHLSICRLVDRAFHLVVIVVSECLFVCRWVRGSRMYFCRQVTSFLGWWTQTKSLHLSVGLFVGRMLGSDYLSVCQTGDWWDQTICMPACLPACLSVYMSVRQLNGVIRLSICLFIWLAETDCLSVGHLVGGLAGSVHQTFGDFSRSVYLFKYRLKKSTYLHTLLI